jgi:N-glycosylase/DNA lyase
VLDIEQNGDSVILYNTTLDDYENIWCNFLDLDRDYGKIKATLSNNDEIMPEAIKCGDGIRILRQDIWETIVSFIISQSNNIPRIKGIIERLCENFGEEIKYDGKSFYSFPSAEKINSLTLDELSVIRAGFRDKYIKAAAQSVVSGELSLSLLNEISTSEAKQQLMSIKGIGNKVSDCILLFGLNRSDSFPVDVWIKRIMEYCYFKSEQPIKTISAFADKKFGVLGGFAQQYLFFYARENKIGI